MYAQQTTKSVDERLQRGDSVLNTNHTLTNGGIKVRTYDGAESIYSAKRVNISRNLPDLWLCSPKPKAEEDAPTT